MNLYAADEEDRILWELVGDKEDGFYIDVGAQPAEGAVSRSFYEAGWTGINIEPQAHLLNPFYAAQPKSRNLCCALSDQEGEPMALYGPRPGDNRPNAVDWTTLSPKIAAVTGLVPTGLVPVTTLAAVCARWKVAQVDWLKIDTETWEAKVIAGADWERWRPRFCCIESFVPHTPEHIDAGAYRTYANEADGEGITWLPPQRSYEEWEPFLVDQGYELVTEYLINRFYRRVHD
jgi:FkbM family methyltransferase